MKQLIELFGWISVGLILLAYGLVSFGAAQPDSLLYQGMNAIGAIGIIASSYDNKHWQPIALNIVWLIIAGFGIASSLV